MKTMQRHAHIIQLKNDCIEKYKALHANVWPEVLEKISHCNIRNYSIYLRQLPDANFYLFSYFEYVGTDFAHDMQAMAEDPRTQEWWDVCKPCQQPLEDIPKGEWWASMEEVFHSD